MIVFPHLLPIGLVALLGVNLATVGAFRHDKAQAMRGGLRVPERTLLGLALMGGTPGAYAARSLFRHKTRKQPFNSELFAIAVLQVLAIGAWAGWTLGG